MEWFSKYSNYIFILVSVVIGLFQLPKLSFKPFKVKPFVMLSLSLVLSFLTITEQIRKDKVQKYDGNTGTLNSPVDAPRFPTIAVGSTKFIFAGGYGGLSLFFDTNSFKLWVKDNKLYADALVFSPDSSIIVRMTTNEFETNPDHIFDKNFDDSTLEVEDKKGNVVLQFQYKHDEVSVHGFFKKTINGNTWNVLFYPAPNNQGGYMELKPPGSHFDGHINPIFKYPSKLHPGERI
jgi:hypothetical protein